MNPESPLRYVSLTGDRFKELEPVPIRVLAVKASHPRKFIIEAHRIAGLTQPIRPGAQAGYEKAGMRFARGPEVLLDSQMEFDAVTFEPASAARRQAGRLSQFLETEYAAIELPERWLAAWRTS